jgi:hypothetical protein
MVCAHYHNDKHVVKMIVETAQLLSTAHRMLDGEPYTELSPKGRKRRRWKMKNSVSEKLLYKATHFNHPSAVWVRQSKENYHWLYGLFVCLLKEYTFRYMKKHKTEKLILELFVPPDNIADKPFTPPTFACKNKALYECGDRIKEYRLYYINEKEHIAKWTHRERPEWYEPEVDFSSQRS